MLIFSPMEQYEIFSLFNLNFSLNQINFYMLIVLFCFFSFTLTTSSNPKLISNWWGILNESFYKTILSMIMNYINIKSIFFLPLLFSIFYFILFSNLIGMIPYSSTITVEIIITLTLAFTILIGILIFGFFSHKFKLFAIFLPAGTPLPLIFLMVPLEILAYLTRTFSLGLRLAVNLITGHILGKVLISFIWLAYLNNFSFLFLIFPLFLISLFLSLELLIAYLQAYIFTFIICITIRDIL